MNRCVGPLVPALFGVTCAIASVPPAGFQETTVASGITQITGFDWAPNGDLWIINKLGTVRVLPAGAAQTVVAANLNVNTVDERGLGGITLHPDFPSQPWVYLYYTTASLPVHNRVSRFEAVGHTLVNEQPLLEGPELTKVFHNAGCMDFGPDGYLYISMGDNAQPLMSQQRNVLLGKILRIAEDGSIPPSNPFVGDPNARPEVWAYGLRNPWRFGIQPGTGTLFIGDVGDAGWEEIDLGIEGANYGYPLTEGPQPAGVAGVTYPIYAYSHNGGSASITAGDHMIGGNFPAQYAGDFFWGDFIANRIYRMRLDSSNLPISSDLFADGAASPVHIRVGPDGALYYASFLDEAIYRIGYVGGANQAPVAVAGAAPRSGPAPLMVQFDGTGSFDPDSNAITYHWFFGDEGQSINPAPPHTYASPGVYPATLTVNDGQASSARIIRIVSGNRAPAAGITSPADGSHFDAGDTIQFSASAVDPEEGALPASAFSWSVLFHHDTHTHPYLGPVGGIASGSFVVADTGEIDPDVWYEIRFSATDSGVPLGPAGALTSTRSISILPNLATLRFRTAPHPGLALFLDGRPATAPGDVLSVVGFQRSAEAISPQSPGDGHTYTFLEWSDGGARAHVIPAPAADSTYTALFGCDLLAFPTDLDLMPAAGGQITLQWSAPADPCLSAGPQVYRIYSATTRLPSSPPGAFPLDPPYSLVGETSGTSLTLTPAAGLRYYVVVGIGSDGLEGPAGHYGN